jgi:hypothetical protein
MTQVYLTLSKILLCSSPSYMNMGFGMTLGFEIQFGYNELNEYYNGS